MTENNSGRKQDIYSVYKLNQRDLRSPAMSGMKDAETSVKSLYFTPSSLQPRGSGEVLQGWTLLTTKTEDPRFQARQ